MIHDLTTFFVQLVELIAQYRTPLLFLACAGLGAAGAWFIAGLPFRERLLDTPNERSSHAIPTPRGAGVGILAAFILAGLTLRIPTTFLFAAILISVVSFYGDYIRISVQSRLVLQILSTLIFLFPLLPGLSAHYASSTFGFPPFMFLLILPLIFIFMIGTANFYNFMDGINGIAGLSGAIGFGLLGAYTLYRPPMDSLQTALSLLSVCVSLACLGYLPFNMPRARVFMGDVGSILLGFVFAGLVVMLSRNVMEMVCFAALLFPFYADELTTLAVRFRDHENLFRSHRRHLYQLLANELGIAHWKVSSIYGAAQLIIGAGVMIAYSCGVWAVVIFLTVCFAGFTILTIHVRKIAGTEI
ncbi:MAG: glycosyltransferase family 4 protein [Deltaproteobacteria bacterium]|nr:glycosyltransferase family 4 protein [Deltaproteobacteria bacterium]